MTPGIPKGERTQQDPGFSDLFHLCDSLWGGHYNSQIRGISGLVIWLGSCSCYGVALGFCPGVMTAPPPGLWPACSWDIGTP